MTKTMKVIYIIRGQNKFSVKILISVFELRIHSEEESRLRWPSKYIITFLSNQSKPNQA